MQTFSKVYDTYAQAGQTVRDLEGAGLPSSEISLIANKLVREKDVEVDDLSGTATGAGIGAAVGGGVGLMAGVGLLSIPGLGPVIAAGWLASTAVGAVAGSAAGGIIGALIDAGTPASDADVYAEMVRRGGTLVTVRTEHASEQIKPILDRYQPVDPEMRRKEYEREGWKGFDPKAPTYVPDQSDLNRMRSTRAR